jgi:hypothetical protein
VKRNRESFDFDEIICQMSSQLTSMIIRTPALRLSAHEENVSTVATINGVCAGTLPSGEINAPT